MKGGEGGALDLLTHFFAAAGVLQGFFGPRVPVDNLDAGVIGVTYFHDKRLINPGTAP